MKDYYIEVGENIWIHKDTIWILWFLAKDSLEEGEINKFIDIFEILKRTRTDGGGMDLTKIISSLENRYKRYQNEVLTKFEDSRTFSIQNKSNEKYDIDLFTRLRDLRRKLADERGVPPYIIFHDSTLKAMATYLPQDLASLQKIKGVGMKKVEEFGDAFLSVIVEYCIQNKIAFENNNYIVCENKKDSIAYSLEKIRKKHPRAYQPWTREEENKLISEYNSDKNIEELMEIFGRQKGGIISRINKLNL